MSHPKKVKITQKFYFHKLPKLYLNIKISWIYFHLLWFKMNVQQFLSITKQKPFCRRPFLYPEFVLQYKITRMLHVSHTCFTHTTTHMFRSQYANTVISLVFLYWQIFDMLPCLQIKIWRRSSPIFGKVLWVFAAITMARLITSNLSNLSKLFK